MMTRILTCRDVKQLLDMSTAVSLIETAFYEHGWSRTQIPDRSVIELDAFGGMIGIMPSYLKAQKAAGVKIISHHEKNFEKGLPEGLGLIILHDPETGMPLAIMDCAYITAVRTGAATAVSVKFLGNQDSRVVGIVGTGAQAEFQVEGICAVSLIDKILAYDIRPEALDSFSSIIASLGLDVEIADGPEAVCRNADVLVTCTSSQAGFVKAAWLKKGVHITALGADMPQRRELFPDVYVVADRWVTDIPSQALKTGDVIDALAAGTIKRSAIDSTLGQIVTGERPGRQNKEEITLFKSTGMAIQDVAVAKYVYEQAVKKGVGFDITITP